jgi:phospholipid/cholesterol/gamma-HCH transport system substrate-binding protein
VIRRVAALAAVAVLGTSCAVLGYAGDCEGTEIVGMFEQVGDLVENSNVQSSDVEVGTVTSIELDDFNARVTMCMDPGERVPVDARFVVRTTSLLGEKFVDVQPQSDESRFLEDGDIVGLDQTGKATELEEVFAKLAAVLGTGNLEQINRFTTAQANILRGRAGKLREVLNRLRRFTDLLNGRRDQIVASVDSLDSVARTINDDSRILERFLDSFAGSSQVLSDQRDQLEDLLIALDRFTNVSVRLLGSTERGLDEQFTDLRPVLRTAVDNSANLHKSLKTLATFSQWFPETMPGDYLQLDVCQAPPEVHSQGTTCPQTRDNDDPTSRRDRTATDAVRYLLHVDVTDGNGSRR